MADYVSPETDILNDFSDENPLAKDLAEEIKRKESLKEKVFIRPKATRVFTTSNQKGGVGKTTTTVSIAAALAKVGFKVLVIDIDPQGNASSALGVEHSVNVESIYDVIISNKAIGDVIQRCPNIENLKVVPSTINLAGAEIELVGYENREYQLAWAIHKYLEDRKEKFKEPLDFIFIDCPPSLGLLTINALVAATEVMIPIQCEYYALEGLSQLLNNISMIKKHLNEDLEVSTILLTMYDSRTKLAAQVAHEVKIHFPDKVLNTIIPRNVRISEAPSYSQTIITYDPNSIGALAYVEAAQEISVRCEKLDNTVEILEDRV